MEVEKWLDQNKNQFEIYEKYLFNRIVFFVVAAYDIVDFMQNFRYAKIEGYVCQIMDGTFFVLITKEMK